MIIASDIVATLDTFLSSHNYDKIFALTDTVTRVKCLPLLETIPAVRNAVQITVDAGDINKNIEQVTLVWNTLSTSGATRNSLLINVGGGMVTDLGGFAAATFKRGIHYINIPTTLMASVDAAVGGKTAVNFNGLKNEVGAFYLPDCVMIDCVFLQTLDRNNILSGYAEMIKHGLIDCDATLRDVFAFYANSVSDFQTGMSESRLDAVCVGRLNELVKTSVAIKKRIVEDDPREQGIRKALNFGHTVGHALESLSFAQKRPLLHGHAVAAGMICELYMSHKACNMPIETLRQTTRFIQEYYPPFAFDCDDYDALYDMMTHDKKNQGQDILFTLLGGVGDARINQIVNKELIFESLDFYRENN